MIDCKNSSVPSNCRYRNCKARRATQLEAQVAESREILARMHENKQAVVLQNLPTTLLATDADADADMILCDQEISNLIHNLEWLHGIQLQEALIRQVSLDQGRSISAVIDVAKGSGMFAFLDDTTASR
jgi:phosphoglycerate-specific signal transduction histidine kinase